MYEADERLEEGEDRQRRSSRDPRISRVLAGKGDKKEVEVRKY
jgi:hypothetical protein